MSKCTACQRALTSENDQLTHLCANCANNLGVIPMPPPRRKLVPCRCCNGTTFIRAIPREVAPAPGDNQVASPMGVTFGAQKSGWVNQTVEADTRRLAGLLEMYVCRTCGYVEWYCSDPHEVPIGPQFMTELIETAGAGPYR